MVGVGQQRSVVLVALAALAMGMTSCVVTAPSATGFSEACAPVGIPLDRIEVKFLTAPSGSTLKGEISWYYKGTPPDGLPGLGVYDVTVASPVAGETRTLFSKSGSGNPQQLQVPGPGKCVHLTSTGGLSYEVTIFPDTDAGTILGWNLGILPLPNTFVWGYLPGSLPPPTPPPNSSVPVDVSGVTDAVGVSAALSHACAALATGSVRCWGLGFSTFGHYDPVGIAGVSGATAVAAGWFHNCAIVTAGAVDCWGANSHGQLGNGTTTASSDPVEVTGIVGATSIAAGIYRTCVVVSGTVKCWGDDNLVPTDVIGITDATQVSVGGDSMCAVVSAGAVKCWGSNQGGQYGDGTHSTAFSSVPVNVPGITNTTHLATGQWHTCTALVGGALKCWGRNDEGQLGIGSNIATYVPTGVAPGTAASRVAAGDIHTCAVTLAGGVSCWGDNSMGALGNGTFVGSYVPAPVIGITSAVDVTAAAGFSCALMADHGVKCWGANGSGQLGHDTRPPAVIGLVRITVR